MYVTATLLLWNLEDLRATKVDFLSYFSPGFGHKYFSIYFIRVNECHHLFVNYCTLGSTFESDTPNLNDPYAAQIYNHKLWYKLLGLWIQNALVLTTFGFGCGVSDFRQWY